jgi:hypothetical protein
VTVRMLGSTVVGDIDHVAGDRIAVRTKRIGTRYISSWLLIAEPGSPTQNDDATRIFNARQQPPLLPLEDVRGCSHAGRCRWCGATDDTTIIAYDLGGGVVCETTCGPCIANVRPSEPDNPADAAYLQLAIDDHCKHLGITRDEMRHLIETRDDDTQTDHWLAGN